MPGRDDPLAGIYAKLHRARALADELARAESEFLATDPWHIVAGEEDGWRVYRAVITGQPPLSLGVIMAETVHQMRSVLDHIAFATARLCDPKVTKFYFPYIDTEESFKKWEAGHSTKMRAEHMAVIRSHQPFALTEEPRHWIKTLALFDNESKHALIRPCYAYAPSRSIAGDGPYEFFPIEKVENNTALARCQPPPGSPHSFEARLELAYGDTAGLLRQSMFLMFWYRVSEVVSELRLATPEWCGHRPIERPVQPAS